MKSSEDQVFKKLADAYAEQHGRSLLQEQHALEAQRIGYATPRADERVRQLAGKGRRTSRRKGISRLPYFAAAAAVLLVFIGVPALLASQGVNPFALFEQTQNSASVEGDSGNSSPSSSDSTPPSSSADSILPLSFTLPAQFSVASVEADRRETIYHLHNELHDDVVLSVSASEGEGAEAHEMDEVFIEGTLVAAKIRDEFKLLSFESGDLLYTISCRDDLATLSALYQAITEAEKNA